MPVTKVLSFNLFDPSGRSWLPCEAASVIQQSCHPLSVVSALSIQDSAGIEEIHPIEPEQINEQARCLLEDITPNVIKVGALFSAEACSVTAQILADYQDIHSVVLLGPSFISNFCEDEDGETTINAFMHWLAPQATTVVIDANYFQRWLADDYEISDYIDYLFAEGVQHCIVLADTKPDGTRADIMYNQQEQGKMHILHGSENLPAHLENSDIFTTAYSCMIAKKMPAQQAAVDAAALMYQQAGKQYEIGMGRSLPNRLK